MRRGDDNPRSKKSQKAWEKIQDPVVRKARAEAEAARRLDPEYKAMLARRKRERREAGYSKREAENRVLRKYGTLDAVKSTGSCDLCGEFHDGTRGRGDFIVQDHDHETGTMRGRLCIGCNTALGRLGDSIAGLERALAYLRRFALVRTGKCNKCMNCGADGECG